MRRWLVAWFVLGGIGLAGLGAWAFERTRHPNRIAVENAAGVAVTDVTLVLRDLGTGRDAACR